jgi:hypothetical protein
MYIRTFLVLDLSLDVVDGVAALDLEGDGLPRQGFHEDLHLAGTTNSASALAISLGFAFVAVIVMGNGTGARCPYIWSGEDENAGARKPSACSISSHRICHAYRNSIS